ncbi:hypothetical protein B0H17DRAFT_919600 [Mycena rosella]|uniref:Altered inheritance of mitochondria protein 6 n=1 Tax=Mycena rosella TaxID=1033263 RepID=A0AAD7M910_MYCRO|nr:hypothetical protein B0H17DRAFT_919600 [Mycena rosella]
MSAIFRLLALLTLVGLSSQRPGVLDEISMLEASNSTLLRYPTDFTQNIVPKAIHSHNDYWRDVPLLTALSFGVASVEADVWLVGETLHVGHEMAALTTARTFDSLYIQPLLSIIAGQNPKTQFTVNQTSINGVFDTSSATPLQLLVDMKTDGPSTLPFVLSALQPLRDLGYLTTCVSNGTCTPGAITVVGTGNFPAGNTPLDGILALSPRDVFFDAPLTGKLPSQREPLNSTFDITVSPLASTDYEVAVGWSGIGNISDAQLSAIQTLVADAHGLGIRARFWDTPGWPINARNNVWKTLTDNGADWLNADDLEAAATMF